MTFLISLPNILRKTIGLKIFGKLYNTLFGFEIMIEIEILKCDSHWLRPIHMLTMLILLDRYLLSFRMTLRYL